jgi:hypothetical protein
MYNPVLVSNKGTTTYTATTGAWVLSYSGKLPQSVTDTTVYPSDYMVFNSTNAATLTLPPMTLSYPTTGDGLGVSHETEINLINLGNTITVSGATDSNTLVGIASPGTLAATNGTAKFISDRANMRWIRVF